MPTHFQVADQVLVPPWPKTTLATTATLVGSSGLWRELIFLTSGCQRGSRSNNRPGTSNRRGLTQSNGAIIWVAPGIGIQGGGSSHQYKGRQAGNQFQLQHHQHHHQQQCGHMPPLSHNIISLPIRNQLGQLLDNPHHYKPGARLRDLIKFGCLQPSCLPDLQGYTKVCHTGLLGRCPFNDETYRFQCTQPQDMSDDYCNAFCREERSWADVPILDYYG